MDRFSAGASGFESPELVHIPVLHAHLGRVHSHARLQVRTAAFSYAS